MTKPLGLRYFQGSESGIYLVCIGFSAFEFYHGLSLKSYSIVLLTTAMIGFIFACCVKWTTLDNKIQTVYSRPIVPRQSKAAKSQEMGLQSWHDIKVDAPKGAKMQDFAVDAPPDFWEHGYADEGFYTFDAKGVVSRDDYNLNVKEHENFFKQKNILYYLLIFQRCCLESLPQGVFFFIVVV